MNDPVPTVTLVDGQPRVSSLDIAEKFEKPHKDVLAAIRKLIADLPKDFTERNFSPSEYTDPTGRKLPMYQLTRDAFSLLAMGFTGKPALEWKVRYIEAFNAMEAELLKKLESKKRNRRKKAIAPAKDRYEAYLEEVEAVRVKTMQEMSRLISMGLDLLDVYKFRTTTHHMFTYILMDWLALVLVRPTSVETRIAVDDSSPVALIRELDKLLPDIRR